MLGLDDAEHEETAPAASRLVITRLACSLAGTAETVRIVRRTRAHQAYGKEEAVEKFRCGYGLNPAYRDAVEDGGLDLAGLGPEGEVRIVELPTHPFFVATLFLPQLSSSPEAPHPLIAAYLKEAVGVGAHT